MRSSTETLIAAMRVLAREINSKDGVAIREAADRLDELVAVLKSIVKHQEIIGGEMARFSTIWTIATRALN